MSAWIVRRWRDLLTKLVGKICRVHPILLSCSLVFVVRVFFLVFSTHRCVQDFAQRPMRRYFLAHVPGVDRATRNTLMAVASL